MELTPPPPPTKHSPSVPCITNARAPCKITHCRIIVWTINYKGYP